MWESNPPRTLLTPDTGFEDQEAHQLLIYLHVMLFRIDNLPHLTTNFNRKIIKYLSIVFEQLAVDISRLFIHNCNNLLDAVLECGLLYGTCRFRLMPPVFFFCIPYSVPPDRFIAFF